MNRVCLCGSTVCIVVVLVLVFFAATAVAFAVPVVAAQDVCSRLRLRFVRRTFAACFLLLAALISFPVFLSFGGCTKRKLERPSSSLAFGGPLEPEGK